MRAHALTQTINRHRRRQPGRDEAGISLMELMVACVVGSLLLYAVFSGVSLMYRSSVAAENQVLASNMAQQVIDNARDSTYDQLNTLCNGSSTSTATNTVNQTLDLYGYTSTFFPRPLLRNLDGSSGMTYTTASTNQAFPGSVTETLQTLSAYDNTNRTGAIKVSVLVSWNDNRGSHKYTTSTIISQTGIHNY